MANRWVPPSERPAAPATTTNRQPATQSRWVPPTERQITLDNPDRNYFNTLPFEEYNRDYERVVKELERLSAQKEVKDEEYRRLLGSVMGIDLRRRDLLNKYKSYFTEEDEVSRQLTEQGKNFQSILRSAQPGIVGEAPLPWYIDKNLLKLQELQDAHKYHPATISGAIDRATQGPSLDELKERFKTPGMGQYDLTGKTAKEVKDLLQAELDKHSAASGAMSDELGRIIGERKRAGYAALTSEKSRLEKERARIISSLATPTAPAINPELQAARTRIAQLDDEIRHFENTGGGPWSVPSSVTRERDELRQRLLQLELADEADGSAQAETVAAETALLLEEIEKEISRISAITTEEGYTDEEIDELSKRREMLPTSLSPIAQNLKKYYQESFPEGIQERIDEVRARNEELDALMIGSDVLLRGFGPFSLSTNTAQGPTTEGPMGEALPPIPGQDVPDTSAIQEVRAQNDSLIDYLQSAKKAMELKDTWFSMAKLPQFEMYSGPVEVRPEYSESIKNIIRYLYAPEELRKDVFGRLFPVYGTSELSEKSLFPGERTLTNIPQLGLELMTDEEKKIFNYVLTTQGSPGAQQYVDDLLPILEERRFLKKIKDEGLWAKVHPELATLASMGTKVVSSVFSPVTLIWGVISGNTQYSALYDWNTTTQVYREEGAKWAARKIPLQIPESVKIGNFEIPLPFSGPLGEALYTGATGLADVVLARKIAKTMGDVRMSLPIMAGSLVGDTMKEGLAQGLDPLTSGVLAMANYAIEFITEKYSLETLLKDHGSIVKQIRKQFIAEGSEEGAADVLSGIADIIISGDKSNLLTQYQELVDKGTEPGMAEKEVLKTWGMKALESTIMGAITGGILGGAAGVSNKVANKSVIQQIKEMAASMPQDTESYQIATRKRREPMNIEGALNLAGKLMEDLNTQGAAAAPGSEQHKEALAKQERFLGILNRLTKQPDFVKAAREKLATMPTEPGKAQQAAEERLSPYAAVTRETAGEETVHMMDVIAGREGAAPIRGKVVGIATQAGPLSVRVQAEDGTETAVPLTEVQFDSYNTSYVVHAAEGMEPADADTMFRAYERSNLVGEAFADAYKAAYTAGMGGFGTKFIQATQRVAGLEKGILNDALASGAARFQAQSPAIRAQAEKLRSKMVAGQGSLSYAEGVDAESLTPIQRDQISYVEKVAKAVGVKVVMYQSTADAKGQYQGANGAYIDGALYLDVNSGKLTKGDAAQYAISRVAAHELTHHLRMVSPELFRQYTNLVVDNLIDRGIDIDRLLDLKQSRAKHGELDLMGAMEEVIADASEMMLKYSKAIEQLAKKNPTLFQAIRDFLHDLLELVKNAFRGVEAEHIEAAALMEKGADGIVKYVEGVLELWDAMLVSGVTGEGEGGAPAVTSTDIRAGVEAGLSMEDAKAYAAQGLMVYAGRLMPKAEAEHLKGQGWTAPAFEQLSFKFSVPTIPGTIRAVKKLGEDLGISTDLPIKQLHKLYNQVLQDDLLMSTVVDMTTAGISAKTGANSLGPLRTNMEYKWTFDVDADCPRRYQFVKYMDAIEAKIGRLLNEMEARNLITVMAAFHQQIPCTYCYVEGKRIRLASEYLSYLQSRERVMSAASDEEALPYMYGYNEKKGKIPESAPANKIFAQWRSGPAYAPSATQLWKALQSAKNRAFDYLDEKYGGEENITSEEGGKLRTFHQKRTNKELTQEVIDLLQLDRSADQFDLAEKEIALIVDSWSYDVNIGKDHDRTSDEYGEVTSQELVVHHEAMEYAKSSSSARLVDDYIPYTDELDKVTKEDKMTVNAHGGFRFHSSNDFKIDTFLDYVQFITHLAVDKRFGSGWYGHCYSKSVDFANIFARTGLRINLSIAINGDYKTGFTMNEAEGVTWDKAVEARNNPKNKGNVGIMAMVTNPDQLSWALDQEWIDMIIPFHASGMKAEDYSALGWSDFTSRQNESYFNADEMKAALKAIGIKVPSKWHAPEIKKLYLEHHKEITGYDAPIEIWQRQKDGSVKRHRPHFLIGDDVITDVVDPATGKLVNGDGKVTLPGHHNSSARYMELCKQYGVKPRFAGVDVRDADGKPFDITKHPGYIKLIKETARTDSEQQELTADFMIEDEDGKQGALSMLRDHARIGGYANYADDPFHIIDMFAQKYAKGDDSRLMVSQERYKALAEYIKSPKNMKKKPENRLSLDHYEAFDDALQAAYEDYHKGDLALYDKTMEKIHKTLYGPPQIDLGTAAGSGMPVRWSLRESPPPKQYVEAYKVFKVYAKRPGELFPAMVPNAHGVSTTIGAWVDAEEGEVLLDENGDPVLNKSGRMRVKTDNAKSTLAYRPGWHFGELPRAPQFYTTDKATGQKQQHENFIWVKGYIAADVVSEYQREATHQGLTARGKYQHSMAGMQRIPVDGYYKYRTNPNPNTDPWLISGSMIITEILDDTQTDAILREAGIEPMPRKGGPINLEKYGFVAGKVESNWAPEPGRVVKAIETAAVDQVVRTAIMPRYSERDASEWVDPMYSQLARAVAGYKGDKIQVDGFVKYLLGHGVKADEIKWSGLSEFMAGKKSMTKPELTEFLVGNSLKIADVENADTQEKEVKRAQYHRLVEKVEDVLTGEEFGFGFGNTDRVLYALMEWSRGNYQSSLPERDQRSFLVQSRANLSVEVANKIVDAFPTEQIREIVRAKDEWQEAVENARPTIYSENYSLPHGANNREIIFTLPGYDTMFTHPHWEDVENPVAHTRIQTYLTPAGDTVLFADEIQSDWHQTGRERGYVSRELIEKRDAINKEAEEAYTAQAEANYLRNQLQERRNRGDATVTREDLLDAEEAVRLANQRDLEARNAARDVLEEIPDDAIPEAPFADTWHEYVVKRLIRIAAEGDYDFLAWTTGQQQIDRYPGLAQDVSEFALKSNGNGTYNLVIESTKNDEIGEYRGSGKKVTPKELAKIVGKANAGPLIEGADRIWFSKNAEWTGKGKNPEFFTLRPQNFALGGEGMKTFYDVGGSPHFGQSSQNIPSFVAKYTKKWNAGGVREITIAPADGSPATLWSQKVPGVRITQEMKDSALFEGQPLFSERESFSTQVDAVVSGARFQYTHVPVGPTPAYLETLGLRDLPMLMTEHHVYTCYKSAEEAKKEGRFTAQDKEDHYHELGKKLKELPQRLQSPVAVLKADFGTYNADLAIVTDLKDNDGFPVIVPVRPDSRGLFYTVEIGKPAYIDTNLITSAYGKKSFLNFIQKAAEQGRVLMADRTRLSALMAEMTRPATLVPRVQYPSSLGPASLQKNIQQYRKIVNRLRPKFSVREGDLPTSRHVLANAFENVTTTDAERTALAKYKRMIDSLNGFETRLGEVGAEIRQLSFARGPRDTARLEELRKERQELETKITNADKILTGFEEAKPLQDLLKREKARAEKTMRAAADVKLSAWRERRKTTESKSKLRSYIADRIKRLDTMMRHETDQKHIPEGFKSSVIELLRAFSENTTVFSKDRLAKVREAYGELAPGQSHEDTDLAGMYDFDIHEDLKTLQETMDGKRLSELSAEELAKLKQIVDHFMFIVKNENTVFFQGRRQTLDNFGMNLIGELQEQEKVKRLAMTEGTGAAATLVKMLASGNITPIYFFKHVGGTFQQLYDMLRDGQSKWAFTMQEAQDFYRATAKKYRYWDWAGDKGKKYVAKTAHGDMITLTVEQAMGLYATWRREQMNVQQKASHLEIGGFVYEDAIEVVEKKHGVPVKYKLNAHKAHPLGLFDMTQIAAWLTENQRGYADEMVGYLSGPMAALGNESSRALFGINKYGEPYYYPYKSAANFLFSHQGGIQDDSALKHRSFTKRTVVKANNPIIASDFTKVWSEHVQDMILYNSLVVPLDTFNRVYNFKLQATDDEEPRSVKSAMEAAFGKKANGYIKQLLLDVNGGLRSDGSEALMNKMISLFKKNAVFGSLSVMVQQPSAIGRAMALIDPKYILSTAAQRHNYEELKRWSGVARIKEMGRFDTNTGRSAAEWLVARDYAEGGRIRAIFTDPGHRDEVLSWGAQKMDEITWAHIWNAVKAETADKGFQRGTEAFYRAAGKRFDDVADYTQVYDSTLSRSELMRSRSVGVKMLTSFMAEPTVTYNMLYDSFANRKRKGIKNYVHPLRAVAAFATTVALNSILKSLVTAARDDDDKFTYVEKYMRELVENILDGGNPLGLVPYGRDILSLLQGWDVSRADTDIIKDLIESVQDIENGKKSTVEKVEGIAGAIGAFLGLPIKNVIRDVRSVYNVLVNSAPLTTTTKSGVLLSVMDVLPGYDASKGAYYARLYDALAAGQDAQAADYRAYLGKLGAKDDAINTGLRSEIKGRVEDGILDPETGLKQIVSMTAYSEGSSKTLIGAWYEADLIDRETADKLLGAYTKDDEAKDRYRTLTKWDYEQANPDAEYDAYGRLFAAIDAGQDINPLIKEYTDPAGYGAKKEDLLTQVSGHYKELYAKAVTAKDAAAVAKIGKAVGAAYKALGKDAEYTYWKLEEWEASAAHPNDDEWNFSKYDRFHTAVETGTDLIGAMSELSAHGVDKSAMQTEISRYFRPKYAEAFKKGAGATTLQARITSAYKAVGADDEYIYWKIKEWQKFAYHTGDPDDFRFSRYDAYLGSITTGRDIKSLMNELLAHGSSKTTIAGEITKRYKSEYIKSKNRSELKARLLNAYELLGYDRVKKSKDIDAWLK